MLLQQESGPPQGLGHLWQDLGVPAGVTSLGTGFRADRSDIPTGCIGVLRTSVRPFHTFGDSDRAIPSFRVYDRAKWPNRGPRAFGLAQVPVKGDGSATSVN